MTLLTLLQSWMNCAAWMNWVCWHLSGVRCWCLVFVLRRYSQHPSQDAHRSSAWRCAEIQLDSVLNAATIDSLCVGVPASQSFLVYCCCSAMWKWNIYCLIRRRSRIYHASIDLQRKWHEIYFWQSFCKILGNSNRNEYRGNILIAKRMIACCGLLLLNQATGEQSCI